MRYYYPSPCVGCTRVKDPEACENKNCKPWQQWFIDRWELIRSVPRLQKETAVLQPLGVPLGGRYYAPPEQLADYRKNDPCDRCLCPRDLCTSPCPVRRAWEEDKEVSYELENRGY